MAYSFLSPEWIEAAHELRNSYGDRVPTIATVVRMNLIISDAPFGEGELRAHVDTSDGQPRLDEGHLEAPDLTVSVDYATAKGLFVDGRPELAMQAFVTGKISIDGDATKLIALSSTPVDEITLELAEKLREITA
ncbi:MAG: SCP2 sterol-binding domain-containing protein [Actinobacteria bacterium]|nr:SCP2 sterol-binding domain-containing protein [Actinomycetota bacterium]